MSEMAGGYPKVSIIVPTYNIARYVAACIRSVQAQTLTEWELILVDDGSTDNTVVILKEFAAADNRLKLILCSGNNGPAAARNKGLAAAGGEYIYFLDSDDILLPNALAELYLFAADNNMDAVFFNSEPIFETPELRYEYENTLHYQNESDYSGIMTGIEYMERPGKLNNSTPEPWRQIWSHKFLRENNISFVEEFRRLEDCLFFDQACILAKRVCHIPIIYHQNRRRGGSVTTKDSYDIFFRYEFMMHCEMAYFLAERRHSLSPDVIDKYERILSGGDYFYLKERYLKLRNHDNMLAYLNPLHEIMYRHFCSAMNAEKNFFSLLQREKAICFCDTEWHDKLHNTNRLNKVHFINIETSPQHIALEKAFEYFAPGVIQVYFLNCYDTIKQILLENGYEEYKDFLDGRCL